MVTHGDHFSSNQFHVKACHCAISVISLTPPFPEHLKGRKIKTLCVLVALTGCCHLHWGLQDCIVLLLCICLIMCVYVRVCVMIQQPAEVTFLKEQPTCAGKAPQLSYLVSKLMGCLHQLEQVSGRGLCTGVFLVSRALSTFSPVSSMSSNTAHGHTTE